MSTADVIKQNTVRINFINKQKIKIRTTILNNYEMRHGT